jgi:hypothetical protein
MTTATTIEEVSEGLRQLTATVQTKFKELREASVPDSEVNDKIDEISKDIDDLKKGAEEIRTKALQEPGDFSEKGACELVEKGCYGFAMRDKQAKPIGLGMTRFSGDSMDFEDQLSREAIDALKLADEVHIADRIVARHPLTRDEYLREKMDTSDEEAFTRRFPDLGRRYKALVDSVRFYAQKALGDGMNTVTSTAGADWIPTGFASNALDEIRVQFPEVGIFPHITMPTNPWTWPVIGSIVTSSIRTENTALTVANPTVENRTWTAKTFAVWSSWSDEVGQDSIIPILPFLRSNHVRSLGEAVSVAIISGDTTSLHIDNDYQALAASHPSKAFDGLREYCMSGTDDVNYSDTAAGTAIDELDVQDAMSKMGKWAAGRPSELALLVTTKQYVQLLNVTAMKTLDVFGPQATIITGEVGRIHGIPVFMSFGLEERKDSLLTGGINGASGSNTLNAAILVNKNYWYLGDRRDVRVETDKDITAGRNDIVTSARWAFNKTHATAATDVHTFCMVNIL